DRAQEHPVPPRTGSRLARARGAGRGRREARDAHTDSGSAAATAAALSLDPVLAVGGAGDCARSPSAALSPEPRAAGVVGGLQSAGALSGERWKIPAH